MNHLDDQPAIPYFIIQDQYSTSTSPQHSKEHSIADSQPQPQEDIPKHEIYIRERYLSKLRLNGLLSDKPRKKCHHITIFDWDDTLFCTTHLAKYGVIFQSQLNENLSNQIKEADTKASNLLLAAAELSLVYIITNAVEGWIEHCLKNFMPSTKKVIKRFGIKVISARSRYDEIFPWESQQWKRKTFIDILEPINKSLVTLNLICIGDSKAEINAAEQVFSLFSKHLLKTVKCYEKPGISELCKELDILTANIRKIIISTKNLQIKLQKK